MKYALEPLTPALLDEVSPLLQRHWEEIAHFKDIPLNPDRATYLKAQELGIMRVYTARLETGQIIGYAAFFVKHNMHYRGSLQANQDVVFVAPEYRGKLAGYGLLRFAEKALKAEGVQVVYHHVKTTNNFGELLERMGYSLVDRIYARRLD